MTTAVLQGELWGTDAHAWAAQEERQLPLYVHAAERLEPLAGETLLEVGCASGRFLRVAADRGARVSGLDASAPLLELARERVPEAELRVGDLQELPFADDSFDIVAGFNSFQFADDVTAALREAARVVRPGGRVLVQMWGRPERCELLAVLGAMAPFLPGRVPGPPGGGNYSDPGVLERLLRDAGLEPGEPVDLELDFEYADEEELLRTMLAAGLAVLAMRNAGAEPVRDAIAAAAAPFRRSDGTYRFSNEWHYLVARAPLR